MKTTATLGLLVLVATGCGKAPAQRPIQQPVACTAGETRASTTRCGFHDDGFLRDVCGDAGWSTTRVCDAPGTWSDQNWQIEFPETLTFTKDSVPNEQATLWYTDGLVEVDRKSDLVFEVFPEERPCSQYAHHLDSPEAKSLTNRHGDEVRYHIVATMEGSWVIFFVKRPATDICLSLQLVPRRLEINLDEAPYGPVLQSIARSMTSL